MIALSDPILGEEEKRALCEVIDSRWLTMGERVAAFEKAFAEMHGYDDAVAVNSCTAALHLVLLALDIAPSDEVLVPPLTFVATGPVCFTASRRRHLHPRLLAAADPVIDLTEDMR